MLGEKYTPPCNFKSQYDVQNSEKQHIADFMEFICQRMSNNRHKTENNRYEKKQYYCNDDMIYCRLFAVVNA